MKPRTWGVGGAEASGIRNTASEPAQSQRAHGIEGNNAPTLTAVFPSSSEARLPPPCLLLILKRLVLRGVRMMPLKGRWGASAGDSG